MAAAVSDTPCVEFWFEFASTYSYLSAMRIEDLATQAGVEIVWRPFLLGPIFRAQGWETSPFIIHAGKGRYMWRDMERLCLARGLPFKRPDIFPQHTLLAARVALAALEHEGGKDFVRDIYRANFERGEDLADPATVSASLRRAGLDDTYLARAVTPENKQRLREQTERAVAMGLFGAPSFTLKDELFWGDDRLEQALDHATNLRGAM